MVKSSSQQKGGNEKIIGESQNGAENVLPGRQGILGVKTSDSPMVPQFLEVTVGVEQDQMPVIQFEVISKFEHSAVSPWIAPIQ